MWKYIRKYLFFAIAAGLFMTGEVMMDLLQPGFMSRIVDDGVLGVNNGGSADLHLIWMLGLQMIGLVLLGGLCGSLNNVFVHISSQNIGNEIRKDCFRRIMDFSFPQMERFGTGSLVTRVTNDITQVQNFVSLFVRGLIRTTLLTFGSMYFMFRLNAGFGLIVLCAFPFLVGVIGLCLWRANPLFFRLQVHLDAINEIMQEDVSGIRIMKACVREAYEKTRFGKANGELVRTQLKTLVIFAFMNPLTNAIMYIAVTVILLAGSFSVGNGRATPGDVMAALTYTTQLLNGVLMLVMLFQNISRGLTSWKRVKEVLESVPELLKLMIRWTVIVGLVCTVLFEAVPGVFIRMFGSADDPVYYDFAVLCLRIYLSLILVTCAQKVCAIFLQSIGKAKAAAPLSVLRDVLLVVFSLLIPVFLGVTGIFLAAPVADVIAILATVAVMVQVWKELGREKEEKVSAAAAIRPSRQGTVITIAREHGSAGKKFVVLFPVHSALTCFWPQTVSKSTDSTPS